MINNDIVPLLLGVLTLIASIAAFVFPVDRSNQTFRTVIGIVLFFVACILGAWGVSVLILNDRPDMSPTPTVTNTPVPPTPTPTVTNTPVLPAPVSQPESASPAIVYNQYAFTIRADKSWQDTGIQITEADFLQIEYISGEWTGRSSSPGYSGPDFGASPENTDECYPIRGEGSSLIGKVGEGLPFKVGDQYLGTPSDAGILYLRMNDCDKLLFDNAGSITVRIQIGR